MGGVLLCFVSLWVDLPTVWNGLGRWERCGIDELTFSYILSFALSNFVLFFHWELWASPSLAQSWACCTARRGHNSFILHDLALGADVHAKAPYFCSGVVKTISKFNIN